MSTQTTMPPVRKTVRVKQPLDWAFALFTGRINQWWPQGRTLADETTTSPGPVVLEPWPQGRVYRRHDDGTIESWGEVRVWEPPHRLVLTWQPAAGTTPASTEVEIRFIPEGNGTRVDLEHRGWEQLGGEGAATRAEYESGWGDVLRLYAAAGRDNGPAIASLILGITSVVLPILGLLAAPFAIAFGIAGRWRARQGVRHGGLATAGLTLGAIGLVLWGLIVAVGVGTYVSQYSSGYDESAPVETSQPGP
jgi:uncharacterized protein YndB with AHSA1/START domain